jgi:hypothetical protein
VSANASWNAMLPTNSQAIGARGRYSDRPTITYQPITGENFAHSMLTPIRPEALLSLIEAGYRADYVLRLCTQSVNSLNNSYGRKSDPRSADPEFYQMADSVRKIQESAAVHLRIQKKDEGVHTLLTFREENLDPEIEKETIKLRKLLKLDVDCHEFDVIYGSFAEEHQIAILSRSMLMILSELSAYIDVPKEDVAEKRVIENYITQADAAAGIDPLLRVYSSRTAPRRHEAFIAIPYRDHWFWIDDRDYQSKSLFSFLMFLFTLAETGSSPQAPILTIPAGG